MKTTQSDTEFEKQLIALCEAYGVHEFAIYGRFAQTVDAKGNICPPDRLIWFNGEPMVAAEAEYHLGLIAEGQKP
ncbi:hypothetical protein [Spirosoma endophyticum]|uniref:Uncharacterized protein n=1 Tax=Spirosoma endophyticum TaxID=662367 RepID=A0A1I2F7J7_9BACT|nr:hypothetical protein [Spirosoma endophyticum]SFF00541.1 hypothetical protein SAMN05216167_12471 [Spirosoma endophyticum]